MGAPEIDELAARRAQALAERLGLTATQGGPLVWRLEGRHVGRPVRIELGSRGAHDNESGFCRFEVVLQMPTWIPRGSELRRTHEEPGDRYANMPAELPDFWVERDDHLSYDYVFTGVDLKAEAKACATSLPRNVWVEATHERVTFGIETWGAWGPLPLLEQVLAFNGFEPGAVPRARKIPPTGERRVITYNGEPSPRNLEDLGEFLDDPAAERIVLLSFHRDTLDTQGVHLLTRSPHLGNLKRLSLSENRIGDRGVELLVKSGLLKQLTGLYLENCGLTDRGVELLGRSDSPTLENLDLSDNPANKGLRSLSALPELKELSASRTQADDETLLRLARDCPNLQLIVVWEAPVTEVGVKEAQRQQKYLIIKSDFEQRMIEY